MKRHILLTTSIENPMDPEEEEQQRLLQAQEDEHKVTQRFEINYMLILIDIHNYTCTYS